MRLYANVIRLVFTTLYQLMEICDFFLVAEIYENFPIYARLWHKTLSRNCIHTQ